MQRDRRQAQANHFALDFPLPYNSDQKPIACVWKLTRRLEAHNRYIAHLDDVMRPQETQLARCQATDKTLRKVGAII